MYAFAMFTVTVLQRCEIYTSHLVKDRMTAALWKCINIFHYMRCWRAQPTPPTSLARRVEFAFVRSQHPARAQSTSPTSLRPCGIRARAQTTIHPRTVNAPNLIGAPRGLRARAQPTFSRRAVNFAKLVGAPCGVRVLDTPPPPTPAESAPHNGDL